MTGKARSDNLANGSVIICPATNGDLVEFLAFFLQTQNADVTDMVVGTSVDAAGNLDFQLANIVQALKIIQPFCNRQGDRD